MRSVHPCGVLAAVSCLVFMACSAADEADANSETVAELSGMPRLDPPDVDATLRLDPPDPFRRLDKDGDGVLEADEAGEKHWSFIGRADLNGDRQISREELERARQDGVLPQRPALWGPRHGPPSFAALLERFDKNGDGQLKTAELPEHFARKAPVDTDQDGLVTAREFEAHAATRRIERFQRSDLNGDGSLSADELGERRWQHLRAADRDENQLLSPQELEQAFQSGTLAPAHCGKRHDGPGNG